MLVFHVAQHDAVVAVAEGCSDFGQVAAFVQCAVRYGFAAVGTFVAFTCFVIFFIVAVVREQTVEVALFSEYAGTVVYAVIAGIAAAEAHPPVFVQTFEQVLGIDGFGNNRTVGRADTGRCRTCAFLYGDDFDQRRVDDETALVIQYLAVGIGIVYLNIHRVLTHAAQSQVLGRAVAAAEIDGRFVFQQSAQIGCRAFVFLLKGNDISFDFAALAVTFYGNGIKGNAFFCFVFRVGKTGGECH